MTVESGIQSSSKPLRLLAVIVLYKVVSSNSISFLTLEIARRNCLPENLDLKVLLYDNTPDAADPGELPPWVQYELAQRNSGLAGAYNRALEITVAEGYDWLLTLDQDSHLPPDFLTRMTEIGKSFAHDASVAAIVPQLSDRGRLLSPVRIRFAQVVQLPRGFVGFSRSATHAYNSGSMLRVSALVELGGFNELFWLDYLDAWLYTHLSFLGKRVYVAGDLQIEHELSLLDYDNRLSLARFQNHLQAESAFYDLYRGRLEGMVLTLRLTGRLARNMKRGDDPALNRALRTCLKDRILRTKAHRLRDWKRDMEARYA